MNRSLPPDTHHMERRRYYRCVCLKLNRLHRYHKHDSDCSRRGCDDTNGIRIGTLGHHCHCNRFDFVASNRKMACSSRYFPSAEFQVISFSA